MIDLAYYNFSHQKDLAFAVKRAEHYISTINDKTCCDDCVTTVDCEIDTSEMPLSKYNQLHELVSAVLFSSGVFGRFTTKYKKKDTYTLNVWLKKMTPDEKASCHEGMTKDTDEDPGSSMD
jgi:hypothetical protein